MYSIVQIITIREKSTRVSKKRIISWHINTAYSNLKDKFIKWKEVLSKAAFCGWCRLIPQDKVVLALLFSLFVKVLGSLCWLVCKRDVLSWVDFGQWRKRCSIAAMLFPQLHIEFSILTKICLNLYWSKLTTCSLMDSINA